MAQLLLVMDCLPHWSHRFYIVPGTGLVIRILTQDSRIVPIHHHKNVILKLFHWPDCLATLLWPNGAATGARICTHRP